MTNIVSSGLLRLNTLKVISNKAKWATRSSLTDHNSFRTYFRQMQKTAENTLPDGQPRYSANKKWHAIMNFVPKPKSAPQYQYQVIIICTLITAIYFGFFRGRSELDDVLDKNYENFHKQRLRQP